MSEFLYLRIKIGLKNKTKTSAIFFEVLLNWTFNSTLLIKLFPNDLHLQIYLIEGPQFKH